MQCSCLHGYKGLTCAEKIIVKGKEGKGAEHIAIIIGILFVVVVGLMAWLVVHTRVQPKNRALVLRRARLLPQVKPGSGYRCGKSAYEQPVRRGKEERGAEIGPETLFAGAPSGESTTRACSRCCRRPCTRPRAA